MKALEYFWDYLKAVFLGSGGAVATGINLGSLVIGITAISLIALVTKLDAESIAIGFVLFMVLALVTHYGPFRAYQRERRLRATRERAPAPRLFFGDPSVRGVVLNVSETVTAAVNTHIESLVTGGGTGPPVNTGLMNRTVTVAEFDVARVNVRNDPPNRHPDAKATDVIVRSSFYDYDSDEELLTVDSRWTENEQPGRRHWSAQIDDIRRRDLRPNGEPNYIDIALKYPQDDACYALTDETCRYYSDWRNPELRLVGEKFKVRVALQGVGMKDTVGTFVLTNPGAADTIRIDRYRPA